MADTEMVAMDLSQEYLIGGEVKGPGNGIEIPKDYQQFVQRQEEEAAARMGRAHEVPGGRGLQETRDPSQAVQTVASGGGTAGAGESEFLASVELSDEQRQALQQEGYADADSIRAASDSELKKVEGVGDAAVKKLRDRTQ